MGMGGGRGDRCGGAPPRTHCLRESAPRGRRTAPCRRGSCPAPPWSSPGLRPAQALGTPRSPFRPRGPGGCSERGAAGWDPCGDGSCPARPRRPRGRVPLGEARGRPARVGSLAPFPCVRPSMCVDVFLPWVPWSGNNIQYGAISRKGADCLQVKRGPDDTTPNGDTSQARGHASPSRTDKRTAEAAP